MYPEPRVWHVTDIVTRSVNINIIIIIIDCILKMDGYRSHNPEIFLNDHSVKKNEHKQKILDKSFRSSSLSICLFSACIQCPERPWKVSFRQVFWKPCIIQRSQCWNLFKSQLRIFHHLHLCVIQKNNIGLNNITNHSVKLNMSMRGYNFLLQLTQISTVKLLMSTLIINYEE